MSPNRMPTLYIPHGGGPCFFMEWPREPRDTWDAMGSFLRTLAGTLPQQPEALLVVSAHWEGPAFTLNTGARPPLLYDYHGFPPHTYQLTYPAPGAPTLALQAQALLKGAGLPTALDSDRGFDHGVFIPLKLVYPDAHIPILQLSLRNGLDPEVHLAAGRALAPLRDQGVLIIGSGMSYHNLRAFGPEAVDTSDRFDAWLSDVLVDETADTPVGRHGALRNAALAQWHAALAARMAHPREEHLLPLMVAAGAAGDDIGQKIFEGRVPHAKVSAYRFG
jgi:aromatic ring-opening dioxygenase catalytic subunit (LigB family)